jgi:branched-chain amino acid transport system substrate-binding protein
MRETPVRDASTENGVLREDGRMMYSMCLFEVKDRKNREAHQPFTSFWPTSRPI